jgi:branched-chain amino acid transport system permease protein
VTTFLAYTIIGIATGCIYSLTAMGLVVTYTTSGIFNFAHGAIGMVMAFTYWELTVDHGWSQPLALLVVLGIFAPLLGTVIHLLLMRGLHGTTIGTQLVVTLGLLLALIGFGQVRWNPTEPRVLPEFFAGHNVRLFSVNVTYHQVTMIVVAVLVAVFLRLLFYRTRIGIAMRAVVDDPELASLNGAAPDRVSMASWAIGAVLAGAAGILLAPIVSLDVILLTLLVINGYAAAMVGRLRSLPLTFAGGIALGLAEAHTIGQLPSDWIILQG